MVPMRVTLPVSAASRPASTCSNVDLPAPFSPTIATREPGTTVRSTPLRTSTAPRTTRTSAATSWARSPAGNTEGWESEACISSLPLGQGAGSKVAGRRAARQRWWAGRSSRRVYRLVAGGGANRWPTTGSTDACVQPSRGSGSSVSVLPAPTPLAAPAAGRHPASPPGTHPPRPRRVDPPRPSPPGRPNLSCG